jgi:hypothetical protein
MYSTSSPCLSSSFFYLWLFGFLLYILLGRRHKNSGNEGDYLQTARTSHNRIMHSILLVVPCLVYASPFQAPSPSSGPPYEVAIPAPEITQAPTLVDRTATPVYKRDLNSFFNSVISELGSNIPSYVASGIPNFFQDFPTGSAVASSLGVSSSDLAALPTQVLNIP